MTFEFASSFSLLDPRALGLRLRRGLVVLATVLPLVTAQLAFAGPPKLPEEASPPPAQPEAPVTTTAPEMPTTAAPPVATPPAPRIAAPTTDDSLALTGENLWNGLEDKALILKLKDGTEVAGKVVAHSPTDLAFSRASDGLVVALPKAEVAGIRLRPSAMRGDDATQLPSDDGSRQISGGAVLTGIGGAAALSGAVMLGIFPWALYINLPLLLPGLAMISAGASMIVKGKIKKNAYQRALMGPDAKLRLSPTFGMGRQGGQAGFVLRF